ncbi:MAG: hypothetical protein SNJ78_12955, partial [Spirochaetales bacterium]
PISNLYFIPNRTVYPLTKMCLRRKAIQITDEHGIVIEGNLPLTTVMLLSSQEDNIKAVLDLMYSLTPGRWIVSPGCDMP